MARATHELNKLLRKKNTFEPKEQGSSSPLSLESGTFLSLFLSLSLALALAQVTTMADSPLVSRYSRGVPFFFFFSFSFVDDRDG